MREMTAHITGSGQARPLAMVLGDEIIANISTGMSGSDWSERDRAALVPVLQSELNTVGSLVDLQLPVDSVNGDVSLPKVYTGYWGRTPDVITLLADGRLALTEAKYLMKLGGPGPFRKPDAFKERVSDKFNAAMSALGNDREILNSLRIIVVTDEQLPNSINRINDMINEEYPVGSYSSDGSQHEYVICSSRTLRTMLQNPPRGTPDASSYLFFTV